ncbi:hypothetical protein Bealeia1_01160 [Candidatus Bealeia paramacronuclearis]|uniref:Uncharacterized protein n=1 Tax=Candidatus Bealeia paramacronuclearis TaxID=1921001 RepID=A0ABZ2C5E3_9PROT|nr:hypothetical protein [Candidatus Bealeia paramacronuclearis]
MKVPLLISAFCLSLMGSLTSLPSVIDTCPNKCAIGSTCDLKCQGNCLGQSCPTGCACIPNNENILTILKSGQLYQCEGGKAPSLLEDKQNIFECQKLIPQPVTPPSPKTTNPQ